MEKIKTPPRGFFFHNGNFHLREPKLHVFPPSATKPEQAMTMREILDKHRKGEPVTVRSQQTPIYNDPERPSLGIHWQSLDLFELQEFKRQVDEQLKTTRAEYAETQRLKRVKAEEEKAAALRKKWYEEQEMLKRKANPEGTNPT